MSDNIMDKICKGCLSHERVGNIIAIESNPRLRYGECPGYVLKDTDCPCQHCLIKAMCDRVCEAFTKTPWYGMGDIL